jgi:hypothetical protein
MTNIWGPKRSINQIGSIYSVTISKTSCLPTLEGDVCVTAFDIQLTLSNIDKKLFSPDNKEWLYPRAYPVWEKQIYGFPVTKCRCADPNGVYHASRSEKLDCPDANKEVNSCEVQLPHVPRVVHVIAEEVDIVEGADT